MTNTTHARLGLSIQQAEKQAPEERVQNWEEVYQGFDLTHARVEAARCIHCPSQPCVTACPVHNDIPGALLKLEHGDVIGAATVFRQTSTLPEMCGRLCPQERLCEGECPVGFAIRPDGRHEPPVSIGKLEAFVADTQRGQIGGFPLLMPPDPTGHKVAVIGSGPSGLTVAEELIKRGHAVTVYDQWHEPGGALAHGIPNFKLARSILHDKLRSLTLQGVDFVLETRIGRDVTVDELFRDGCTAVYLGTGAGVDEPLNIPGEDLTGVVAATDFLVRANASAARLLPSPNAPRATGQTVAQRQGPRVVVVGGSDAAMDCVRAALRLGASEVTLVYEAEAEALESRLEEITHAREEGVRFRFGARPVAFEGDAGGRLTGLRCARAAWAGDAERERRRAGDRHEGTFLLDCDLAVVAHGYVADPFLRDATPGLETDAEHRLIVDRETGRTTRAGVFAGGDGVHGADLVVTAIAAGKRAAAAIDAYLRTQLPGGPPPPLLAAPAKPAAGKRRGWFGRGG
jgi:glutamate synthase (NADPH/NADH) small chain